MDHADRTLTVVFGPSRSRFFPKAVAHARAVATEIAEPEPGRYRAAFTLGVDPGPYAHASALIERVRHWRGSEVYLGPIPVSPVVAKDMAWCAGDQLRRHGTCTYRYFMGVPRRCPACPLYEPERAEREMRGEGAPPPIGLEIELGPNLRAILRGEVPTEAEIPDFVPGQWEERPL
jgi:hypothetical protein